MRLVKQPGAQQDVLTNGTVHTFAKPECGRVVFFCVIDWLERLRTDPLHIPKMEKLMRCYADESRKVRVEITLRQSDRGAV